MHYPSILRLSSVVLICFNSFICSPWASDSDSSNEEDNRYISGNRWAKEIQETAKVLDCLDETKLTLDKKYRQRIEGNFYNYLDWYKNLDFSHAPEIKLNMANKLRTYETNLFLYYNGTQFKPEDLWNSELELEYLEVNNMQDLNSAIKKGASEPPAAIIELIRKGGSTGFPLNSYLPPKFFRMPSNYMGERFLVGGERSSLTERQDDYMLNFDRKYCPDILADANNPASYVCIPDNKFSSIEYDFIDNRILISKPVLEECRRILCNNGTFIFRTQRDSEDFYRGISTEIQEGEKNLKELFNDKVNTKLETDNKWPDKLKNKYWSFVVTKSKK